MWVLLAAGTAVLYAVHGAWSKRMAARVPGVAAAWGIFAFSFPLLLGYLVFQGVPDIGPRFAPALAANALLNLASAYLFVSALRMGELGVTVPLLALTPIFMIPVEWVLLGAVPGPGALLGIVLVVIGVYLLNFTDPREGLLEPFRALARDPGARRILLVAMLWSVSSVIDRVAVLESSAGFYGAALSGSLAILFLPLLAFRTGGVRAALRPAGLGAWLLHGILFGAMFILQMEALRLTLAAHVISFKRTGALLSVVIGAIFFREVGLRPRLTGTAIIIAGATVLALMA
jgi:drug/metabolite transporter (DMT)-like permease